MTKSAEELRGQQGRHGPLGWYAFEGTAKELQQAKQNHLDTCIQCQEEDALIAKQKARQR